MGNEGAFHWPHGVDEEIALGAVEPFGPRVQELVGAHAMKIVVGRARGRGHMRCAMVSCQKLTAGA